MLEKSKQICNDRKHICSRWDLGRICGEGSAEALAAKGASEVMKMLCPDWLVAVWKYTFV